MTRRIGLRTKMTASYVLVTASVVIAVEAVVIGVVAPTVLSGKDVQGKVQTTAVGLAGKLSAGFHPGDLRFGDLGSPRVPVLLGSSTTDPQGGLAVPQVNGACPGRPFTLAVLVAPDGRVLATSAPRCYPRASMVSSLPGGPIDRIGKGSGRAVVDGEPVFWAGSAVSSKATVASKSLGPSGPTGSRATGTPGPAAQPTGTTPGGVVGFLYVQAPAGGATSTKGVGPFIRSGLLLLLLTVVVGAGFGLLSTRRLTRRLGTLARTTEEVAGGDFAQRIPVSGSDEVSQLEQSFNTMASQLSESSVSERRLTESNARLAERSRIARELHDSISQDLFSLSMLAGGLRKALPADAAVRPELAAMEETATRATREMQALLLELRPIALEGVGLTPALEELCRAYRERLGVPVEASLEELTIPPPVEHAVLRVAQEALANAVRHGDPGRVSLAVHSSNGSVEVCVADDGVGFDTEADGASGGGMGLQSMRERVEELGGSFEVESSPGSGTVVSVSLPRSPA